jgi:nucleoside 2-deoxyribosyltransferase
MSVTVFLSGAIDYVGEYATSWRQEATFMLSQRGYKVLDPTSIPEDDLMSPEEIAQKNIFMQKKSDILLVEYMLQDRAYIGTDFELAWAKIHGQPSVVICNSQYKERVYMKYMATKLADNLQDAIEYIAIHYPTN